MLKKFIAGIILVINIVALPVFSSIIEKYGEYQLDLVKEIVDHLENEGMAVIFGAPSSGKSEQMEMALPNNKYVFDLSQAFVDYYSEKTGLDRQMLLDCYGGAFSPLQEILKQEQVIWLSQEKQAIINSLTQVESKLVIIDEFDFMGSYKPTSNEETAIIQMVAIGSEVKKMGKQIIFIIHPAAKNSELFWLAMEKEFKYGIEDIARTKFFTDEEEEYLLSLVEWTEEEKSTFLAFAQGSPTAYLSILKNKPDLTLEKLKVHALTSAKAVVRYTRHINRPEVWDVLVAVALGQINLEDIQDEFLIEGLLESGFVGRKNGQLVMPVFSKQSLL